MQGATKSSDGGLWPFTLRAEAFTDAMPDFRAYCTSTAFDATEITLSAEESHHLVVVNRAREGNPVVVFDGRGTEWMCELVTARKQTVLLRVRSRRQHDGPRCEITLGQAIPKGAAMDAIVRKATELGARRLAPLVTERTQVHLAADRSDRKSEKWHTAAIEAAKQCGNPFVPEITAVHDLRTFVRETGGNELKLIASLAPGAKPLKKVMADFRERHGRSPRNATWLIGPEGDFSPDELAHAVASGFEPITFGQLVLRCETAAIYAISVLRHDVSQQSEPTLET